MKILRTVSKGVAGIFFPIGKPECGGTCQYASEVCPNKCYTLKKDYDETVNIPEEDKKEIYRFFIEESLITICNEVIKEMGELQSTILSWFSSGDCLDKDIDKLYRIMFALNEGGIIQNGFTRNVELYGKTLEDGVLKYIVLTIESKALGDSPEVSNPRGLWAIPDYKSGLVKLHYGTLAKQGRSSCGFNEVSTKFNGEEITIATNCLGCYNKKIGCFVDLPLR